MEVNISAYLKGDKSHQHAELMRLESCKMLLHTERLGIDKMMQKYSPSEEDWQTNYKKDNFRLITKTAFSKIENVIQKIGRAQDFIINYPTHSKNITPQDSLENYCEKQFGKYKSVKNWIFAEFVRHLLTEPNGFIAIMPKNWQWDSSQRPQPIAHVFRADQIVDYTADFALFSLDGKQKQYILFTKTETKLYTENEKRQFVETLLQTHNFGFVPCCKNGGKITSLRTPEVLESFIAGVLEYWDQILLENADLQVSIKTHLYPESVEYVMDDCKVCEGTGAVQNETGTGSIACSTCGGAGLAKNSSRFNNIHIPVQQSNEIAIPNPAKYYVQKDISPVQYVDSRIKELFKQAYAAVNMEFLAEVPAAQSGIAKSYDWDALNLFLYGIAIQINANMEFIYKCINFYRYKDTLSPQELEAQMPQIIVPESYDVVGANTLIDEINAAKLGGVESAIIAELEKQYASKRFVGNAQKIQEIDALIKLDPLYGKTEDEKERMFANGSVTLQDYTISSNIKQYLAIELSTNPKFLQLPHAAQRSILQAMADLTLQENASTKPDNPPLNEGDGGDGGIETPIGLEAQAKANLKGTVGGVQGILNIQRGVSEGITDYSAAIAMLMEIYGYAEATAKKILGTPAKKAPDAPQPPIKP